MNCKDLLSQLDDYLDSRLDRHAAVEVENHLAICASCSAHARVERLLRERLQALPAPPPPRGYSRRMLSAAYASRPVERKRRMAVVYLLAAASLLVAVGAGWMVSGTGTWWSGAQQGPVVTVNGGEIQRVQLVFNSPGALSGVTMHVGLPAGVELAEYPGVRELTWQVDLKPGANLLALPVIVRGDGGTVMASVSFGAELKQFSVVVHAANHAGASLRRGLDPELFAYCPAAAGQDIIAYA